MLWSTILWLYGDDCCTVVMYDGTHVTTMYGYDHVRRLRLWWYWLWLYDCTTYPTYGVTGGSCNDQRQRSTWLTWYIVIMMLWLCIYVLMLCIWHDSQRCYDSMTTPCSCIIDYDYCVPYHQPTIIMYDSQRWPMTARYVIIDYWMIIVIDIVRLCTVMMIIVLYCVRYDMMICMTECMMTYRDSCHLECYVY